MKMILLQLEQVNEKLLDYGPLGIMVILCIIIIVFQSRKKDKHEQFLMDYIMDNVVIMERFTNSITQMDQNLKEMPANVGDKIKPELQKMESEIKHMRELIKSYKV